MRKITKRFLSSIMVAVLVVSAMPYNGPLSVDTTVQAATDLTKYSDDYIVDLEIIKSSELLSALNEIIPKTGEQLTFGMLKAYDGAIDLTNYPNINDVTGLGYAVNASSMDLSALTKITKIYESEFRECKFTEFKLPVNIVEIETKAFLGCSNLKTIVFPDTLKKIGGQAFESCSSLDNIEFPDGLEKLGDESFANCKSLKEIVIPDNINAALDSSENTEALSGIGASVFNGCVELEKITFGAAMTVIPAGFLQNTESLYEVEIPEKITDIRSSAFAGSGIMSIDLSKNTEMTVVNTMTFSGCSFLSEVKLPDGITVIESNAFNSCISLKNTDFIKDLNQLTEIGSYAFAQSGISTATIPGNVETIGLYAFTDCDNLTTVTFDDFTYEPTEPVEKSIGNYAFSMCSYLEEVVLPEEHQDNVNTSIKIGNYAFTQCYYLEKINFPMNLTRIGDYAFYKCSKDVTDWQYSTDEIIGINKGYAGYIGQDKIYTEQVEGTEPYLICTNNTKVEEYYQPTLVYINPDDVFRGNYYDEYVASASDFREKYADKPELIEQYSKATGEELDFLYVSQVYRYIHPGNIYERVTISSTEDEKCSTKGVAYVSDYYISYLPHEGAVEYKIYVTNDWVQTVYINPDNVYKEFYDAEGNKLTPELRGIRSYDYFGSEGAVERYIFEEDIHDTPTDEADVSVIVSGTENMHIQHITGLSEIDLSSNIRAEIGVAAFADCKKLKKAVLPDNLTVIPDKLFSNCYTYKKTGKGGTQVKSLNDYDDVWYYGLESVVMSDDVTDIGSGAFEYCYRLRMDDNNNLPKSLVTIGEYAFRYCQDINKVILPSTLESVGSSAFYECSRFRGAYMIEDIGLTELEVSGASSLKHIGSSAFARCSFKLFDMNSSSEVQQILTGTFTECQYLERVMLAPSVKYVGKAAMNLCYNLESVHAPDTCVLDSEMCMGTKSTWDLPGTYPHYIIENENGTSTIYFHTKQFVLSVDIQNPKFAVRENGKVLMPLSNVDADGNSFYKLIKIGDNSSYTYNPDTQTLTVDVESEYIYPEIVYDAKIAIEGNEYSGGNKNEAMWGIRLGGLKEVTDLKVVVEQELSFIINKTHNTMIGATPNAQYSVDVTKNPCSEIQNDDRVYVGINNTKTIAPVFVPKYADSDITDIISWNVETGDDLITVVPSEDGKTAQIVPTKTKYGTASIKVTAGEASKIIYINVATPATKLTISETTKEMSIGAEEELSATLSYASADVENAKTYGDNVIYSSSDESIVKVEHYSDENGVNVCKLIAVGYGKAVITAKSMANEKITASCTVYVAAESVDMTVTDSNGNPLEAENNLTLLNAQSVTYNYNIESELNLENVSCDMENPEIIEFSYNSNKNTFTLKAKKRGSTKVVVYPSAASAEQSGIVFYVTVDADVKDIVLSKKDIPVDTTANVFVEMINVFGDTISETSDSSYVSLTHNRIEFTSSNSSIAEVDDYGNVTALKYSSRNSVVTITCTAYSGDEEVAIATANVYILEKGAEVTTESGDVSTDEPVKPVGFTCVSEKKGTILINAVNPGNGQQYNVYVDGYLWDTVSSLPAEITGLDPGESVVYIKGYLNGVESEWSDIINVVILAEDPTTEPVTEQPTTEPVTEQPTENHTEQTTTEQATTKPVTTQPVTTKVPSTTDKPTTKAPTTSSVTNQTKPAATTTVATVKVGKAKVKKVARTKNNKKAKITLKKIKGATGYEISYSTNKKFKKKYTKTVTVKKLKRTIKKLKANKKYYVRARAYVLVGNTKVFGKWSKVKTVKVKK